MEPRRRCFHRMKFARSRVHGLKWQMRHSPITTHGKRGSTRSTHRADNQLAMMSESPDHHHFDKGEEPCDECKSWHFGYMPGQRCEAHFIWHPCSICDEQSSNNVSE